MATLYFTPIKFILIALYYKHVARYNILDLQNMQAVTQIEYNTKGENSVTTSLLASYNKCTCVQHGVEKRFAICQSR
jgi:hypothetical protein